MLIDFETFPLILVISKYLLYMCPLKLIKYWNFKNKINSTLGILNNILLIALKIRSHYKYTLFFIYFLKMIMMMF